MVSPVLPQPNLQNLNAIVKVDESRKKVEASFIWHNSEVHLTAIFNKPVENVKASDLKLESSQEVEQEIAKRVLHSGMQKIKETVGKNFFQELKTKIMTHAKTFEMKGSESSLHVEIKEHSKPKELGQLDRFKTILEELIKPKTDANNRKTLEVLFTDHPEILEDIRRDMTWEFAEENIDAYHETRRILTEIDKLTGTYQTDEKTLKKISADFGRFWRKNQKVLNIGSDAVQSQSHIVNDPSLKTKEVIQSNVQHIKKVLLAAEKAIHENTFGVYKDYLKRLDFRIEQNTPAARRSSASLKKGSSKSSLPLSPSQSGSSLISSSKSSLPLSPTSGSPLTSQSKSPPQSPPMTPPHSPSTTPPKSPDSKGV